MATNITTEQPTAIVVGDKPIVQPPQETVTAHSAFPPGLYVTGYEPVAYRRVYVWELPVRIFHVVNGLCIILLAATGYVIGNPQAIWSAGEAYQQQWFGIVRFLHFAAGYVFLFNLVFRVYWSFAGNEYANWRNYIPYRKDQMKNLWEVTTTDVFQLRLHRKLFIGHNYMASFSYFVLFLVSVLQIITGFALYASMSDFFLPQLFAWATPLFGGDASVRQWHHILMWVYVVFTLVHVYLVFYHDVFEGRGTTSSIIGGWTFMKDNEIRK
jgi:Ni/Fe-hydrogenase 1 B-type cytochrome subunit